MIPVYRSVMDVQDYRVQVETLDGPEHVDPQLIDLHFTSIGQALGHNEIAFPYDVNPLKCELYGHCKQIALTLNSQNELIADKIATLGEFESVNSLQIQELSGRLVTSPDIPNLNHDHIGVAFLVNYTKDGEERCAVFQYTATPSCIDESTGAEPTLKECVASMIHAISADLDLRSHEADLLFNPFVRSTPKVSVNSVPALEYQPN